MAAAHEDSENRQRIEDAERFFCKVGLSMGILTPAAVEECLAVQRDGPLWRRIGEIMMERGYLDHDQLQTILQVQGTSASGTFRTPSPPPPSGAGEGKPTDAHFNALVRLKKLAAGGDLQTCYDLHEVLLGSDQYRSLSGRLMRKAYSVAHGIEDPIRLDGRKVVRCRSCREVFHVPEEADGRFIPCSSCGNLISKEPDEADAIDPMSRTSAAARAIAELDARRAEQMRDAKRRAAESVGRDPSESGGTPLVRDPDAHERLLAGSPDSSEKRLDEVMEAIGGDSTRGRLLVEDEADTPPFNERLRLPGESAPERPPEPIAAPTPTPTPAKLPPMPSGGQPAAAPASASASSSGPLLAAGLVPEEPEEDDPLARAPGMLGGGPPAGPAKEPSDDDPLARAPGMLSGGPSEPAPEPTTPDPATPAPLYEDDDFQTAPVPRKRAAPGEGDAADGAVAEPGPTPFVRPGSGDEEDEEAPGTGPAVRFDARPKSGRKVWRPRIR